MKFSIGIALAVLVLCGFGGCVQTELDGFTDKAYEGYHIRKIAIRATENDFKINRQIENTLVKGFANAKIPADSFMSKFPPTREWTNNDVATDLDNDAFDTIMYVSISSSDMSSQVVGYQTRSNTSTSGNVSVYGNKAKYGGTTTTTSTTTPTVYYSRETKVRLTIYDIKTGNVIWVADCNVEAGGSLFMGDQTQFTSMTGKIIKSLTKSGLIETPKKEKKANKK